MQLIILAASSLVEGGFIPYEVDLLTKNGCQAYHLGNRILRTETAISYLLGRLFA